MRVIDDRRMRLSSNKRAETHWVPSEIARLYPWIVAKRDTSRAQSAYLLQRGPAFRVGRSHPQIVCECLACGRWCVADECAVRGGRTISCGCKREIHGLSGDAQNDRTYKQWRVMRRRHKDGIKVQPEWVMKTAAHGIKAMIADLGATPEGMVLREIVVGGGYIRGNTHWVEKGSRHNRRKRVEDMALFAATAKCPKCDSYRTGTRFTNPEKAYRCHGCLETGCGHIFKTRMAEKLVEKADRNTP